MYMKYVLLVIALLSIVKCDVEEPAKGKLFDLDKMLEQKTLNKFLSLMGDGDITSKLCLEDPIFFHTKIQITPTKLAKGEPIRIKAAGAMKTDINLQKIHLETYYNGETIFVDNVEKHNQKVKKGAFFYEYEASVPAFVPAGTWKILLTLVDQENRTLSCLQVDFVTS